MREGNLLSPSTPGPGEAGERRRGICLSPFTAPRANPGWGGVGFGGLGRAAQALPGPSLLLNNLVRSLPISDCCVIFLFHETITSAGDSVNTGFVWIRYISVKITVFPLIFAPFVPSAPERPPPEFQAFQNGRALVGAQCENLRNSSVSSQLFAVLQGPFLRFRFKIPLFNRTTQLLSRKRILEIIK